MTEEQPTRLTIGGDTTVGESYTIAVPPPPLLVITGHDGTPLVTMDPRDGGTITVHDEDRLDEAARRFIAGVRQLLGVGADRDALLDVLGAVDACLRNWYAGTRDDLLAARDRARRHLDRTEGL